MGESAFSHGSLGIRDSHTCQFHACARYIRTYIFSGLTGCDSIVAMQLSWVEAVHLMYIRTYYPTSFEQKSQQNYRKDDDGM